VDAGTPYERHNVALPGRESITHFIDVLEAIINAGDAAERARDVVEHTLHNMRQDAKLGHARGGCAPQIVQRPVEVFDLVGIFAPVDGIFPPRLFERGVQLALAFRVAGVDSAVADSAKSGCSWPMTSRSSRSGS
jgi:hypothetical protein